MRRVRILRIVTRLNTGGPARHLTTLARALDSDRYEQWLAAGREGAGEGSMRSFVEAQGVRLIPVLEMVGTSRLGPADVAAMARIRRLIRDIRPDIVETHTTKAGIVGRRGILPRPSDAARSLPAEAGSHTESPGTRPAAHP